MEDSDLPPTRILMVEDDRQVADVVRGTLLAGGHSVEWSGDSESAMRRLRERRYDLVIVDIELPGTDGLELVSWLREAGNDRPIMFLTARRTTADVVLGLQRGADDYLTKPFDPGELRARVHALLRRDAEDGVQVLHYADLEVDELKGRAWRGGRLLDLSRKELELLTYFVRRPETPLTSGELLRDVWKMDPDSDTTLLRVTLARLRRKLDEHGGAGLIKARRGVGFLLEHGPEVLGHGQKALAHDGCLVGHGTIV